MSARIERIGEATLYLGDCLEILPTLGTFDAVVSDPPYGIKYSPRGGGAGIRRSDGTRVEKTFTGKNIVCGDDRPFDPRVIRHRAPVVVLWGGNHFASRLPDSPGWFIWDKRRGTTTNDFADCEMAWSNLNRPARLIHHLWNGMLRDSERGLERVHPTQKPIAVMQWLLDEVTKRGQSVCDPFMGSGTTGVACAKMGRKFIGIEIDSGYFDIACRRIEDAYRQADLFVAPPAAAAPPEQGGLP